MDIFKFKSFSIWQDHSVMRVNTDGVLLAAWLKTINPGKILDIGCGTGVIALIMAQRFHKAQIKAIDNNKRAYELSKYNFQKSVWNSRLEAIFSDLNTYSENYTAELFDLIISNPPFFIGSTPSQNKIKTAAKHADVFTHREIILRAFKLLKTKGDLALILPVNEAEQCMREAEQIGFVCVQKCFVYPDQEKKEERIMFKLAKDNKQSGIEYERIYIRSGNPKVYSPEYREITKELYLNF